MIRFFCILICLIFSSNLFANPIDSLSNEISKTTDKKDLSDLYSKFSKAYQGINLDSAMFYAKKGLIISKQIDYTLGIAELNACMADYYVILDSLEQAKKYYKTAADNFSKTDNYFDYAELLMVLGNVYFAQDNYPKALNLYLKSLVICEENNFIKIQAHLSNNIGVIYFRLEDYNNSLEYYEKAVRLFNDLEQNENSAQSLSNIASIYSKQKQDSLAVVYYLKAKSIYEQSGDWIRLSREYNNLGLIEMSRFNYEKANTYFNKAVLNFKKVGKEFSGPKSLTISEIYKNIAFLKYDFEKYDTALIYAHKSLDLSYRHNYIGIISDNFEILFKTYETLNNADSSLKYHKLFKIYSDSLYNERKIKDLTQIKMQYEFDKDIKEKELEQSKKDAEQKRKELIYILIFIAAISIAVVLFLLFINQRIKTHQAVLKRKNIELDKENLTQKLEYKNKELTTNVMYLLKKNEFITTIAEKLDKTKSNFKIENKKTIQSIINDLERHTKEDAWEEFEMRFQEVHSEFYDKLSKMYPDLTPNEIKLCAFLRLNMSTKEISAITYQSVKSINMARFRLRKKLDIERDDNIISYLSQL